MDKTKFVEICKELNVRDVLIEHLWAEHRPPDHVPESTVRDAIPQIAFAHELAAAAAATLPDDKKAA